MRNNNEIIVRPVQIADLESLKTFFIKAYGENTIFRNEQFLIHYFDADLNSKPIFSNCLIGVCENGDVVSHYGGLEYNLTINREIHPMIWGVSAYTLPEYRGKGLNSQILKYITDNHSITGVIGFSEQTSQFYKSLGYNIFNFKKFTRHILILDYTKSKEISNYIKLNSDLIKDQNQEVKKLLNNSYPSLVVELTLDTIKKYKLDLNNEHLDVTTTHRTKEFLMWRFFNNPFIKYTIYGVIERNLIVAYIALREETLSPFNYRINRIIDLYGKTRGIEALLHKTLKQSVLKKHIYVDFSKFGLLYEKELNAFNFMYLENEDCCILPQVTAPISDRPNGEFLGILSKSYSEAVKNLNKDNVYFTRMDSDRDRIANINQIHQS